MKEFNEFQTPLTESLIKSLPKEVVDEFWEYVNTVPFIQRLVSPDRKRAKDLPRDEEGKIIVDLSNPHILEDMDYFRETAIHYQKHKCFTKLRVNTHPQSEYMRWFKREIWRIWHGMVRPTDGEWITGDMYFYLNYFPIIQTKIIKKGKARYGERKVDLPEVWEGVYWRFHYWEQAKRGGLYNDFEGNQHAVEIARRGAAHPYSQKVLTPEGYKIWGDIQVGDLLYGTNNDITKVVDIPFDDEDDIYTITLYDGRKIQSSLNHLWNVYRHSGSNRDVIYTMPLKDILKDYKRTRKISDRNPNGVEYIYSIPKNEGIEMPERTTKIDPYTFGLLLGDGTFAGNWTSRVGFSSRKSDMEVYKRYIPYDTVKWGSKNSYGIIIDNVKSILQEYNLYHKRSEFKFIPEEFKYNSREVRMEILKGLMDTDGSVDKRGIPYIGLSSKRLIEDVQWICRSLGYNCSYTKNKSGYKKDNGEYKECLPSYILRIFTNDPIFKLERKLKKLSKLESNYSKSKVIKTRIINIEYSHREKCKCVTVDSKDNSYLIGDFVQTHNSKSYSVGSKVVKNFVLGIDEHTNTKVKSLIAAYNKEYLVKDGTLNKVIDGINFLASNTQFPSRKIKNSLSEMQWIAGWTDEDNLPKGSENEILGISISDDPDKIRGKRPHPLYCNVLTPDGYKKWGDIQIGDYIYGDDGKPTKVIDIPFEGEDDIYKITLRDGRVTYAGKDHQFLISRYFGNSRNRVRIEELKNPLEIKELKAANKNKVISIPKNEGADFKEQSLFIDPYVMGLYLGDGCYSKSRMGYLNLTMSLEDMEALEKYIPYKVEKSTYREISHKVHIVESDSSTVNMSRAILTMYGLQEKSSPNKFIPKEYLFNSRENRIKLLKGLMDSDGTICVQGISEYCTKSEKLKDDFVFLCRSLGINCSVYLKTFHREDNVYYMVKLHVKRDDIFNLPRKKARCKTVSSKYGDSFDLRTTIDSVEYVGKQPCKCVTVDNESHLYLIDDFITTHNSNHVFYEEYAVFPKFLDTWQVALPNVQEGSIAFGQNIGIACVCADTKVWDGNNLINIQDVNTNILGYDSNNIINEDIVYKTPEVYKECVEIILQGGKSIKCSVDHPLLCNYGSRMDKSKKATFKEANTIKRGDRLLMPITPHSFGNKRMWNPRLVGLLIGDGNYSASCCCPDLAINSESIYKYIDDNFDTNFKTLEECTDGSMYARVWLKGILPEIKNLGIYGQSKDTKTLPDNIYSYTRDDICELLGGYFDADGNVQLEDTTIKVKLTCKSRNLIEQVHYLLLSLGIHSSIMQETKGGSILKSKVNNKEYNMPAYTCNVLYITNYSAIKKFRELIYFVDTEKQRRLELIDIVDINRIQGYMTDIKFVKTIDKGDYFIDKVFSEVYATVVKEVIPIGVQRVYNLTANTTHTYMTNGILSHNTGGSEGSDFMGALEMIQHPRGYNVYALPNVYDKNSSGKRDTLFFFPGYVNIKGFYNKDGVSDVVGAMIDELKFRHNLKYNSSDPIQLSRRKAETAFTIQDAIMKTDSTIYPVADLNDQINWLDNNPTETQKLYVGKLILRDGEVEWKPDPEAKPINNFPHKDNKLRGAVVIKEHPIKGSDGKVPWGRYISGADTIDTDGAETLSLFSCYVLDLWTDEIVAEYTGREELTDDSFEIYRLLLMYYNAEGNYENNKKGLFSHFSKFNSLHLLADTLEFLREKDPQRQRIGNATKGTPSSVPIKNMGRRMIRDFLLKPYDNIQIEVVDGVDTEVKTTERSLKKIRFRALLQELATHNMDGNFDRHDALVMLMLIREDKLRLLGDDSWENRYERDKDYLGDDPFFNSNYGGEDTNKQFLETMKRLGMSV